MGKPYAGALDPPPVPDGAALHGAALSYLARFSATEAGVRQVLQRRVARWARLAEAAGAEREQVAADVRRARDAIAPIVARLSASGAINDASFAEARARRLARAGKSRRAVAAHLAAKGVDAETAALVLPEELPAALAFARRRRIGPFRADGAGDRLRELGMFARAGFAAETAGRVLRMTRNEADAALAGRDGGT